MNTTEVDALVRSVIVHLGLPFAVLSVVGSPAGWNIEVRRRHRRRGPLYGPWQPAAGDAGRDSGEAGSGA